MAPYVRPYISAHGCAATYDLQIWVSSCPFANPTRALGNDKQQGHTAVLASYVRLPRLSAQGYYRGALDTQPTRSAQAMRHNLDNLSEQLSSIDNATTEDPKKGPWHARRRVHGSLGVHVDDTLGGDDATFQKAMSWLKTELKFGAWGRKQFRFRGRELEQSVDNPSIVLQFLRKLGQHLRTELMLKLILAFAQDRGRCNGCNYKATPKLSDTANILRHAVAPKKRGPWSSTISCVAKAMKGVCCTIKAMPGGFPWWTMADVAWANRSNGKSASGHLAFAAHPGVGRGELAPFNLIVELAEDTTSGSK